ncbi:MAG: menaquinone biosynthesis protein [Rikenellaceae bacterium]
MNIAAVSYLNTAPMIWGISQAAPSLRDGLVLAIPSKCAELFCSGAVDVALMPVAAVASLDEGSYDIITDYCISAEDNVQSVALLSNTPLQNIETIYLDTDSKTSVLLVRVLAREYWKITPQWVVGIPPRVKENEAIVAIGDKVFEIEKRYTQKWDLAKEWINHTNLPFVFALWVARKGVEKKEIEKLNQALGYGVQNIEHSIKGIETCCSDPLDYLKRNIRYELTPAKSEAIRVFWEKIITPG